MKELIKNNPGLFVTAVYIYVSSVGFLYSGRVYSEFGINILNYAEPQDFLLEAFRNIKISIISIVILLGAFYAPYLSQLGSIVKNKIVLFAIVVSYSLLAPYLFDYLGMGNPVLDRSLKNREVVFQSVYIKSASSDEGKLLGELEIIGSLGTTLFLYDHSTKKTIVISKNNIQKIEIINSNKAN